MFSTLSTSPPHWFLWPVALILGALLAGDGAYAAGALSGACVLWLWRLNTHLSSLRRAGEDLEVELADARSRITLLEARLSASGAPLEASDARHAKQPAAEAQSETFTAPTDTAPQFAEEAPAGALEAQAALSPNPISAAADTSAAPTDAGEWHRPQTPPEPLVQWFQPLREFLWGGNTLVRVGVLVLLVGVVLLLKWAADNNLFPIELRMLSAAATAALLIGFGYRTRTRRKEYGVTLQGAGVAALYLVVFFSFKSYELLPGLAAFTLLAGISLFSCLLATLQNSRTLILLGALGGFVAPILASTGAGSHVALFSWYLVLNLMVLAISVVKNWRSVALVGFAFTFGIGTAWGVLRYEPRHLASTEPFLLLFAAIYAALPVLMQTWQLRHPGQTEAGVKTVRGIDSTLTFGTPLAFLGLQAGLLREHPMAMALTLASVALAYVGAAIWLHRRSHEAFASAIASFLTVGVGLGTLALPYALRSHNLTSAGWALEGAGMFWVGVRQGRRRPQLFGVLLQVAASVALSAGLLGISLPLLDTDFYNSQISDFVLTTSLVGITSYFTAFYSHRHQVSGSWAIQVLLFWGLLLWLFVGVVTADEWMPSDIALAGAFAFTAATCLLLETVSKALRYTLGRLPALLAFGLSLIAILIHLVADDEPPGAPLWLVAWILLLATQALSLRDFIAHRIPSRPRLGVLLVIPLLCTGWWLALEAADLCRVSLELDDTWVFAATTAALSAHALLVLKLRNAHWLGTLRDAWHSVGMPSVAAAMLFIGLITDLECTGDPAPLPFVPLLNPYDSLRLISLAVGLLLFRASYRGATTKAPIRMWAAISVLAFVWFNSMLARSVHHLASVPFSSEALWSSSSLQWVLSGAWTAVAVALMTWSSKRALRGVWIAGAILMGTTVLKLFLVDLDRQSTVARILTFLAVGGALLVVGYLSPLPPKRPSPTPETAKEADA